MENQSQQLSDLLKQPLQLRERKNQRLNKSERFDLLKTTVDRDGNVILIRTEDGSHKLYLQKLFGKEEICLGILLVGERNLLYFKYEDERNIFRKLDAWSINLTVFNQVDHIVYETLKNTYQISKDRALEFGQIIHFDSTEEKIYIPLKYWDTRKNLIDKVEERRRNLIGDSWYNRLGSVLNSDYMSKIGNYIRERRTKVLVYPDEKSVFRAYKLCSFEHTKVVILGQNPYVDGSADGLAFSYKSGHKKPVSKSLDLIVKEVERDLYDGFNLDFDYQLDHWATQGVLLLNSSLTVEHGQSNSHLDIGWDRFVKITLYELLKDIHPRVYLLWGSLAQKLFLEVQAKIVQNNVPFASNGNLVLQAKHPASDLYGRNQFGEVVPDYPNTFSGNRHFSQANKFLKSHNRKEIIW